MNDGMTTSPTAADKVDLRRARFKNNLSGKTFGRWTVIRYAGTDSRRYALWLCECNCEEKTRRSVSGVLLRSGESKSCGCLHKDILSAMFTKHGRSKTKVYASYHSMRSRVLNSADLHFKCYGGRGITICQRWLDSFEAFYDDMAKSWRPKLTLDRKDVNGNYCPENCCWATRTEQNNNKRTNRYITYEGATRTVAQWAAHVGLPWEVVYRRVRNGWDFKRVLEFPHISHGHKIID